MRVQAKTKEQHKKELQELRLRMIELEKSETHRKQVEERLRESEERYKATFEKSRDAINIFSKERKILDVNQKLIQLSGFSKKELLTMKLQDLYPEAVKPATKERIQKMLRGEAPPIFGTYLHTKKGKRIPVEIAVTPLKNCFGQRIVFQSNIRDITERKEAEEELKKHREHLEELVEERTAELKKINVQLQKEITERKQTEEALWESKERFKELWNNAPVAYHTLDTKGIITSVNQTEAKMLGFTLKEMVGRSIFEFILPGQKAEARRRFKQKISGKHIPRAENRIYIKKDGSKLYVVIDDVLERSQDGKIIGIRTTMVDITNDKRAEDLLRQSEEKYRVLGENAMDGIYIISTEGFEYVNPAFEKLVGHEEKEVCNKGFDFFDLIHPEDRKLVAEREQARKNGKKLPPKYTFRIITKEGKIRYVEPNTVSLPGERLRVLGILRDITERKQTEEALRESEEKYRTLVEQANDGIVIIQDKLFKYVNKRLAEISGYTVEELIDSPSTNYISPKDLAKVNNYYKRLMAGEEVPPVYELEIKHKDGHKIYVEFSTGTTTYQGKPADLVIVRDITERKRAREAIKVSEERYRDLVEKAGIAILIDDREGNVKYCNKKYAELFGYTIEEMRKQSFRTIVHSDDVDIVMKFHEGRIQSKKVPTRYEFRGIKKDGSTIYLEVDAVALKEGGNVIGTRSYIWDITERKQSEEALQASEEKFKTLFNNASDAIFIHDLGGRFLEVNQVACERLGYTREELLKMTLKDIDSPKLATMVPARTKELDQRGHIFYETVHVHRTGKTIPIELSSRIIEYEGEPVALSIARDITERKRAEEERKQSFERLRKALEETVNALASAVEMRDPYTAGHQHRVTNLAWAIAREMGLSAYQLEGVRMAGIIHDVGKIRVPAEILSWPGRLKEIDFNVIKTHPQVGYDILKRIEFPYSVAQIMLQHHERMDGSGYPGGLSGEEILMEARILAVADVVEAMASHRPYRPALGIAKALEEISKNKGILYDPDVVDTCLKLFNVKNFKFK